MDWLFGDESDSDSCTEGGDSSQESASDLAENEAGVGKASFEGGFKFAAFETSKKPDRTGPAQGCAVWDPMLDYVNESMNVESRGFNAGVDGSKGCTLKVVSHSPVQFVETSGNIHSDVSVGDMSSISDAKTRNTALRSPQRLFSSVTEHAGTFEGASTVSFDTWYSKDHHSHDPFGNGESRFGLPKFSGSVQSSDGLYGFSLSERRNRKIPLDDCVSVKSSPMYLSPTVSSVIKQVASPGKRRYSRFKTTNCINCGIKMKTPYTLASSYQVAPSRRTSSSSLGCKQSSSSCRNCSVLKTDTTNSGCLKPPPRMKRSSGSSNIPKS